MTKRVGSAVEPFIIDQHPQRRKEIETQLFKDFTPKDVLEEIWLSDIAVLTATIEYYRQLEAAVMLKITKRRSLDVLLKAEFPERTNLTLNDAVGSMALRTALGEFTPADLKQVSSIADLISQVRRERERVFLLFERKRRPALLSAVKVAQSGGIESYAIEKPPTEGPSRSKKQAETSEPRQASALYRSY